MARRRKKVVKYRRTSRSYGIGFWIFLFVFGFILVKIIQYFNSEHISIYEVVEKQIADDNIIKGIAIREETIFYTDTTGYVNYYIGDREKVAKGATVYTIDASGEIYHMLTSTGSELKLDQTESDKIRQDIALFRKSFQGSNYGMVQELKYNMENAVLELTNAIMAQNLQTLLKETGKAQSFKVINAKESGIITYFVDGLEELKADQITMEIFTKGNQRTQLRTTDQVEKGSPAYKLVKSEDWQVVLPLKQEQYEKVKAKEKVEITFLKDNLTTTVPITTYQQGEDYFGRLSLDKYMVRYIDERFLDIELSLITAEGFKIPVSAIVEKDFYLVPIDFFTTDEVSGTLGIELETYKSDGTMSYEFVAAEKYYEDEEYAYIDTNIVTVSSWIHKPETKKRYQIGTTKKLEGVYNFNNGYAVFRRIEKEYGNKEYCIIKKETLYGVSTYDHIIANANIVEN